MVSALRSCIVITACVLVVAGVSHQQAYPYVSFKGNILNNHSYVDLSEVGIPPHTSVQCITNLSTCCSRTQGSHRGDWYFPDGSRLQFSGDIYEHRDAQRVVLRRDNDASSPTGIYCCQIPINNHTNRPTVYVGLYTGNEGSLSIPRGFNVTFDGNESITLTFKSVGGPVTNVTWTRNSTILSNGSETLMLTELDDPVTAQYTHTLTLTDSRDANVVSKEIACSVYNNKPTASTVSYGVIISPSSQTITVGMQMEINCTSTAITNDTVVEYWWILPNQSNTSGSQLLTRHEVKSSDAGLYTCHIIGSTEVRVNSNIFVEVPVPTPYIDIQTNEPLAGTPLTIMCNYSINPNIDNDNTNWNITWSTTSENNRIPITGTLVNFSSITTRDSGRYTCTLNVTSESPYYIVIQGSPKQTSVAITVKIPAPTVNISLNRSGQLYAGTGLTISCTVTLSPAVNNGENVSIIWSNLISNRYTSSSTQIIPQDDLSYQKNLTISPLANEDNKEIVKCIVIIITGFETETAMESVCINITDPLSVKIVEHSENSLNLMWTLVNGVTATDYRVTYSNLNTECFNDSNSTTVNETQNNVLLQNLQEGTEYSITLTATVNNVEETFHFEDVVMKTTLTAAPSSPPANVRVKVKSSTSIEVHWGPVDPCKDRNGEIIGYSVRYGVEGSGEENRTILNVSYGESNGGIMTISELTKKTTYTVDVAAKTSAGIGVYSHPPVSIKTPDDVFVSLNGTVTPNHGYVLISHIGSSNESALLCHTNFRGSPNSGGDWYKPDGTRVGDIGSGSFERNRASMLVRLRLRNGMGSPTQGIFECRIDDSNGDLHTLYVGLYNEGSGNISISRGMVFQVMLDGSSLQLSLTCVSTGGPAATVTWTRDSTVLTEGNETVLNDLVTASYTHTLNLISLQPGLYKCSVQNDKPSEDSAEQMLKVSKPISNLMVEAQDVANVKVNWLFNDPEGVPRFRVYYHHPNDETIQIVNDTRDLYHETNSSFRVYTVSVQVISDHLLPSDVVGPVTVRAPEKIGEISVTVVEEILNITWQDTPKPNDFHWNYTVTIYDNKTGNEIYAEVLMARITMLNISTETFEKGVPYTVAVYITNGRGNSDTVSRLFFSEEQIPSRGPVGVLLERLNDTHMMISWRDLNPVDSRGHLIHYSVYYWPVSEPMAIFTKNTTHNSVIIGGLEVGETYGVKVSATTGAGNGPFSGEVFLPSTPSETGDSVAAAVAGVMSTLLVLIILSITLFVIFIRWKKFHRGSVKIKRYRPTPPPKISWTRKMTEEGTGKEDMEMENISEEQSDIDVRSDIPDREFPDYVRLIHGDRDHPLEVEYKSLEKVTNAASEVGRLSCNISHNRFKNIFPYDHTRVKLAGDADSDYINASFIDGYANRKSAYIASQGPTELTVERFWEMVWQYKVSTIVMLTRCNEDGKAKCEQYWPKHTNSSMTSGRFNIITDTYVPSAEYQIRKMIIKPVRISGTEGELEVTHMHYTAWPDHGVPRNAMSLISFIHRVRKEQPVIVEQPLLVHCSAGVGRTGTFILLDLVMQQVKREGTLSVYRHLRKMRCQRMKLVQTQTQYAFIYDSLSELMVCGETVVAASDVRLIMGKLQQPEPGDLSNIIGYHKQYQTLEEVSSLYPASYLEAQAKYNSNKNRFPDKLPNEQGRVRLKHGAQPGSDYINASFIDGYKQRKAYIATQGPLADTVDALWRMVWENQCTCIVILCETYEHGRESCHGFWPEEGEGRETVYGKLRVKMSREIVFGDIIERKLEMGEVGRVVGTQRNVTVLQLTSWASGELPHPTAILSLVDMLSKVQRSAPSRHTIIMCSDGVGRTGTFICIHSQLERLKTEGVVDIFQAVKSARIQRAGLVSDPAHYAFCYDVVATYLDSFETYANFKDVM